MMEVVPPSPVAMKKLVVAAATLLLAGSLHAAPASPQSVEAVLEVTRVQTLLNSVYANLEPLMRQSMQQALGGRKVSPEEQHLLDALPAKLAVLMRDELAWEKLKPLYVQVYSESFDQEEIDALLVFYRSPAGQALIGKMPVVMQKSMALVQGQMQAFMPKMQQAIDEAMAEAKKKPS